MRQEEILEYNKRCAEFLGSELKNDGQYDYWTYEHLGFNPMKISGSAWISGNFEFHSDWNWIHEVKNKICQMKEVDEFNTQYDSVAKGYNCTILPAYKYTFNGFYTEIINTEQEAVIQAINQFLIWYNENN